MAMKCQMSLALVEPNSFRMMSLKASIVKRKDAAKIRRINKTV